MNIGKGIFVFVLGMVSVRLIDAYIRNPEVLIAFSIIYLASVIAAKSFGSKKN